MKPIKNSNLTLEQALTTVVSTIVNQQLKNDDVLTDSSLNVKKKSEEAVVQSNSQDALGNWITTVAPVGDGKVVQVISGYSNGITFLPAVGSIVVLDYVDNNNVRINYTSGIEHIELSSDGMLILDSIDEINITSRKQIVMSGGYSDYNGGLIKIRELTEKLNKLVDEVNALKDKFNNHIHTITAPLLIAPTPTKATAATKFNKDDYENMGVIH